MSLLARPDVSEADETIDLASQRAMTLAQFLEMRYSRRFRLFMGGLAFLSGILNYGIFPAISARFFIYFLDLPTTVSIAGMHVSTLALIMGLITGASSAKRKTRPVLSKTCTPPAKLPSTTAMTAAITLRSSRFSTLVRTIGAYSDALTVQSVSTPMM